MKSDLPSWTELRSVRRCGGGSANKTTPIAAAGATPTTTTTTIAASSGAAINGGDIAQQGEAAAKKMVASAAIQDHISCTAKPQDLHLLHHHHNHNHNNNNNRILRGGDEQKVALACELDHMYAHATPPADEQPQVKQLRDLLLLNLDLIQQQELQLKDRERQLSLVKQDRDYWKQKHDRVERRLALQKQKDKAKAVEHADNLCNSTGEDVQDRLGDFAPSNVAASDRNKLNADRRPKRKSANTTEEVKNHETTNLLGLTENDVDVTRNELLLRLNPEHSAPLSPCEISTKDEVPVPSWRFHPVTSCYQLEKTENLEDEVFMKRHQKLEIEEKRQNKRDYRRIRDLRQVEKLKRGQSGIKEDFLPVEEPVTCTSLFPNPDDAHYVEVCDTVPVCAFGFPVPTFQPCEFSLPWVMIEEQKSEKRDRQKPLSPKRLRTSDGKPGS